MEKNKNEINLLTINPNLTKLHLEHLSHLANIKDIEAKLIFIKESIIPYSKRTTDVLFKDLNKLIDEIKNVETDIQNEIEKDKVNEQQHDDKDNDENYQYYSTNSDVLSALANGLFGWGFNESTTWMDYIQYADLKINKDSNNNIVSADIGLSVLHSGDEELIYYTIDNFNSTSVSKVETFLNNLGGN